MRSITLKLTLAFLITSLIGTGLAAALLHQQTRTAFNQFILSSDEQNIVDTLMQYYQDHGSWEGINTFLRPLYSPLIRPGQERVSIRRSTQRFTLVNADYRVLYANTPEPVGRQVSNRELENAIPLKWNNETIGWVLRSSRQQDWTAASPEAEFLNRINQITLVSTVVAAGLALLVGSVLALTMTRSLRELTEMTREIARGKLGAQVQVRTQDELGILAASFNQMSLDLQRSTQARKQMTADIAHDLRSPISVISGYAEALSDGKLPGTPEVFSILHQESLHLNRLVEDLRTLSLADAGELSLMLLPTDLHLLLEQTAARHALEARQKGISLQVEAPPSMPMVKIDPERMAQVLANLVGNAFRFTPAGGSVTLSAQTVSGGVQIEVSDTGSGILPADLPYIFDRFYRGDKSRQGSAESGLGLAIARSIVEAHGGKISARNGDQNGAVFTIFLPNPKP